ncbi:MAG: hypothetical protein LBJ63_03150 [Prevotellaceae bacterium]|nr:hypothetical protein [Prevotellaceae bacterium]
MLSITVKVALPDRHNKLNERKSCFSGSYSLHMLFPQVETCGYENHVLSGLQDPDRWCVT